MEKRLKAIAAFTLLCFVTTQCASAYPGARIEMAGPRELPFYQSINIPEELGTVDALYEAPTGANPQFILHIQNAHANYQAQMKIKQLLGYMNKQYGFKTIFVEGASEKLDADYLRLFPDQERNLKLCDELAKQGELTGAELFLMEQTGERGTGNGEGKASDVSRSSLPELRGEAVEALGIEESSLYKANYSVLKKVFGAETDVSHFFRGFDGKLDRAASRTFTPEMRELIADWKRFEQGRREFMPFVKSLAAKSRKILKVDLESLFAQVGWPQITRLLVIQMMEKDLDKKKGVEEQAALLKMLRAKNVSRELLRTLENFKEGSITVGKSATEVSPREVLERLASEAGPKGFKFSDYPAFSLYAGYVTLRSELDAKVLFEEIEYLFTQMLDALAQEPEQKALLTLYRDGELLRKLLHLELNRAQWRQVLKAKDRIAVPSLVLRLKECLKAGEGETGNGKRDVQRSTLPKPRAGALRVEAISDVMPPKFAKTMDGLFTAGLEFYDYAHKREAVFYKEMQTAMTERKINKAILITGGFHTDGMSDLFRENAVSYGIVTPRLSEKSNENLYRKVMLQNREYPFSVSYLEEAIKAGPLTGQPNPANAVETILAAGMKAGGLGVSEMVPMANESPFAARNEIRFLETGKKDPQGRAEVRIVPRTSPANVPESVDIGGKLVASTGSIASLYAPTTASAERSEMRRAPKSLALTLSRWALITGISFFAYVWTAAFFMARQNEEILRGFSKSQVASVSTLAPTSNLPGSWETLGSPFLRYGVDSATGLPVFESPYQVKPVEMTLKPRGKMTLAKAFFNNDPVAIARVKTLDNFVRENWPKLSKNLDPYIRYGVGMAGSKNAGKSVERPEALQQALWIIQRIAPERFEILKKWKTRLLQTQFAEGEAGWVEGNRFFGAGGTKAIIHYVDDGTSPAILAIVIGGHEVAHIPSMPATPWDFYIWLHTLAPEIVRSMPTEEKAIVTGAEPVFVDKLLRITPKVGQSFIEKEALEWGYRAATWQMAARGFLTFFFDGVVLFFLGLFHRKAKESARERTRWGGGPQRFRSEIRSGAGEQLKLDLQFPDEIRRKELTMEISRLGDELGMAVAAYNSAENRYDNSGQRNQTAKMESDEAYDKMTLLASKIKAAEAELAQLPPARSEVRGQPGGALHTLLPEQRAQIIARSYQDGTLGLLDKKILPPGITAEQLKSLMEETAKNFVEEKIRKHTFSLNRKMYGSKMDVYSSPTLGVIVKSAKEVDRAGVPIDFERQILPGFKIAKDKLGGLFVFMIMDNLTINMDGGKSVTFKKPVIVQERLRVVADIYKGLEAEIALALEKKDAENVERKSKELKKLKEEFSRKKQDLQQKMWLRGFTDGDVGNWVNNYGLTQSGEFLAFDVDQVMPVSEAPLETRAAVNEYKNKMLIDATKPETPENEKNQIRERLRTKRVSDIFYNEIQSLHEAEIVKLFEKAASEPADLDFTTRSEMREQLGVIFKESRRWIPAALFLAGMVAGIVSVSIVKQLENPPFPAGSVKVIEDGVLEISPGGEHYQELVGGQSVPGKDSGIYTKSFALSGGGILVKPGDEFLMELTGNFGPSVIQIIANYTFDGKNYDLTLVPGTKELSLSKSDWYPWSPIPSASFTYPIDAIPGEGFLKDIEITIYGPRPESDLVKLKIIRSSPKPSANNRVGQTVSGLGSTGPGGSQPLSVPAVVAGAQLAAKATMEQLPPVRSEVREGKVLTPEDVKNGVIRIGGTSFALGNTGNKEMAVAQKGQADIVLTDLDALGTVSKIEALVFQALFFDSITHPRAKEYRDKVEAIKELKAKKDATPSEIAGKEAELRAFLDKIGYHDVLLPGMILSRRLPIVVPSEAQRERVIQMLINVFAGLDSQTLRSRAEALPSGSGYSPEVLETMLKEFESNRSFTFPGAAFFDPGTGKARTNEEIGKLLAEEILDIRVATAAGIEVRSASGDIVPIRYEAESGRYMVGEFGSETVVGKDIFEQQTESFQEWPVVQKTKLQKELDPENSTLRVIDFGTGDPSPFSGNQDYTNLAFMRSGEIVLIDPSVRTLRNLEKMGLEDRVNAISLSHVHYDHVGGILDLLYRRKSRLDQAKLKLIAPVFVYVQLRLLTAQTLGLTEDEATKFLAGTFDWQIPSIAKDSLIAQYDLSGGFSNVKIETLRTFGHPLPTFGFKVTDQTTGASVAYLTDSRMPSTISEDGTPNLRHKEMIDFYGGADLLLGENGVPGVHITADELVRDFPEHVDRGSIFTVHAAGLQTKLGLQRFSPFMVLPVQTRTEREEEITRIRKELDDDMAKGVFPKLSDATRDALAVATRRIEFNPGEIIFTEGRPVGDNPLVFIHVGGEYDVWVNGQKVASRVPPGLLGEMGVIMKKMTPEQYGALEATLGKDLERFVVKFKSEAGEVYAWDANTPDLIDELPEGPNKDALLNAWKSSTSLGIRTSTVKVTEKSRMLSMEYGVFMNLLAAYPDLVEWAVQTTKIRTLGVQVAQIKEKEVFERTVEGEALGGESLARSEARKISPMGQERINRIRGFLGQGKTPGDIWDTMIQGTQDRDTTRLNLLTAMDVAMPEAQAAARNLFINWVAQEIRMAAEGRRDAFGYGTTYDYALGLLSDRGVKLQGRFTALKYAILHEQKSGSSIHKDTIRTLLTDMLNSNRAQKMNPLNWVSNRSRAAEDSVWDPVSEILDDISGFSKKSAIDWKKVWIQFNEDGSLRKAFGDEKVSQLRAALARLYPLSIAQWARDERKTELQIDEYGRSLTNRAEIISLNDPAVRILTELGYEPSAGEDGRRINEIDWWLAADTYGYPRLLELAKELRESPHTLDRRYLHGRVFGLGPIRQKQISDVLGFPDQFRSGAQAMPARVMAAKNIAALAKQLVGELDSLADGKSKPTVRAEGDRLVIATSGMGEVVVSNLVGIKIEGDHFLIEHWDSAANQLKTDTVPLVLSFRVPNDRPQVTLDEYRAMVSISKTIPEAQVRTLQKTSFAALRQMGIIKFENLSPQMIVAVTVTYGIVSNEKKSFEAIAPLLMQMALLIDAQGLAGIVKALQQAMPAGTKIPISTESGNAVMILEDLKDSEAIIAALEFNILLHPNVAQYVFVRDTGARTVSATTLGTIKQWLAGMNHKAMVRIEAASKAGTKAQESEVIAFLQRVRGNYVVTGTRRALDGLTFATESKIQVVDDVWSKKNNRPIVMDITARAAQVVDALTLKNQARDLGIFISENGEFIIDGRSILALQNLQVLYEAFQAIQAAA